MNPTTNRNMDPEGQPQSATAAVDRILMAEEKLVPSSGFVAAVMERVRDESAAPAPIPFPWKRIAPGLVLAAGTIGWGAWQAARFAGPAMRDLAQSSPQIPAAVLPHLEQTAWVVLALAVSWAGWALSMRLVRRSGLI
ncbi:MAG: hypothetical protein ACRD3S_14085 [Terracidiphilus sp.]